MEGEERGKKVILQAEREELLVARDSCPALQDWPHVWACVSSSYGLSLIASSPAAEIFL